MALAARFQALNEGSDQEDEPKPRAAQSARSAQDDVLWDTASLSLDQSSLLALKRSPLARRIVLFNLIGLNVLMAAMLLLSSSRDVLSLQRAQAMQHETALIARLVEAAMPDTDIDAMSDAQRTDLRRLLGRIDLLGGERLFVFDTRPDIVVGIAPHGAPRDMGEGAPLPSLVQAEKSLSEWLGLIWRGVSGRLGFWGNANSQTLEDRLPELIRTGDLSRDRVHYELDRTGHRTFAALSPIEIGGQGAGSVVLVAAASEIDAAVDSEQARMLLVFVIATLVSVGLSLALASTIANPIAVLASAAEMGRDRNRGSASQGRVRIPDMTDRPDEIGRLSGALRGMVSALFDRIDGNEQFAADVAHEIKNPLASLRSAVGSLRLVKREDHQAKLLDVIEHDVRRLDRLVSDISNASRLDGELVKEDKRDFDLVAMLRSLGECLSADADKKGVEFYSDLPDEAIVINGIEARFAQVFVNLIGNAISFCDDGDTIRVWARRRDNRVLLVVEDTGPGIPDEALSKIFKRFYSQRPEADFGNNSGLGLAISKQIVEAHGGVIWAENIRPTEADITSEPLGARFVVGLRV